MRILKILKLFDTCTKNGLSSNLSFKRRHGLPKANMDIAFEYANFVKKKRFRDIFNIILDEVAIDEGCYS